MNNNDYIYLVGENLLNSFSNVFMIDIKNDLVNEFIFENTSVKLNKSASFLTFIENVNSVVSMDDSEAFINIISGRFDASTSMTFKSNRIYEGKVKTLIAKKIINNNNEIIMAMIIETDNVLKDNKIENVDTDKLYEELSEVILKIYNTIDMTKEDNPAFNYIKNILDDFYRKYPKLNNNLEKNILSEVNKTKSSLLIVDDDLITRNLLKKAFEKDFDIVVANNGKEAIDILEENELATEKKINFVGIFLDIEMPILNGFAVLEYLEQRNILTKMPVIIISGVENKETRQKVYNYNIADMLEKPFNLEIIRLRINNFIRLFKSSNSLSNLIASNDRDINKLIEKVQEKYFIDYESKINHVAKITDILAKNHLKNNIDCGLTLPLIDKIKNACKYYDIGKILISDKVLDKENLTEGEVNLLKEHTLNGGLLVKRIFVGKDPILEEYAYNIAMYHHDNLEDSLYSKMNNNKEIPLYLSIVSLAIMYVDYALNKKESNHSVIATNIIALENIKFKSELINTFRLSLNEIAKSFQDVI